MKTKSVSRTVYPDGKVEVYTNGMIPKRYIAKNTVKPGGVCLNWGMENALKEAREVFKNG